MTATTNRIDRTWATEGYEIGQVCTWYDSINNEPFCGICAGSSYQTVYNGVYYAHWNQVLEARGLNRTDYFKVINLHPKADKGDHVRIDISHLIP